MSLPLPRRLSTLPADIIRVIPEIAAIPRLLADLRDELQSTRESLDATRAVAERVEARAVELDAHAIEAIGVMREGLEELAGGREDLSRMEVLTRDAMDRIDQGRALLDDVNGHLPAVAEAAEGLARVEDTLGLIDRS
ncbi:hypothetical protein [Euzebya rosea]|uniref:hypothetical protein n=1 Tax=Euzebya rosea TaxID=2052804 RepID=UPI00130071D5|nr:hypothetical protein [Euzebya rosea]